MLDITCCRCRILTAPRRDRGIGNAERSEASIKMEAMAMKHCRAPRSPGVFLIQVPKVADSPSCADVDSFGFRSYTDDCMVGFSPPDQLKELRPCSLKNRTSD